MDDQRETGSMASERILGRLCDTDREVDLGACMLVLEVTDHSDPSSDPDGNLVKAFVLVDAMSVADVWDAMLAFHNAPELLVDLSAIDGYYSSRSIAHILYTDQASAYLSTMVQYDILQDSILEGFIRQDAWLAFSENRLSSEPLDHAGIRTRIATMLGLPILDRYLDPTEKPLPHSDDPIVDDSYLAFALSHESHRVDGVAPVPDASSSEVPVDPTTDMGDEGSSGNEDASSVPQEPDVPSEGGADSVGSDQPSSDAVGGSGEGGTAASVPVPRGMRVASPPSSGRRTFPTTAKILEARVPLHGFDGEDASAVIAALDLLRASVPWMANVVDVVEEEVLFSWSSGLGWRRMHPLLLSGPSGAGKTRFAHMLADAMGLKFAGMSFAGSTDNRTFEGTSVGWMNAKASWPTLTIADLGSANPMLLIDEVEKIDSTYNGDPRRTLVTMLDPEVNHRYLDVGLDCAVDLSAVSWILCCNEHRQLDVAFRDRLRVVEVVGPSAEHLPLIVAQAMKDIGSRMGVDADRLPDMGDLMLSKAAAVFRTSKSMRSVVRCVDDAVRHRVVADARRGIRLPPASSPTVGASSPEAGCS